MLIIPPPKFRNHRGRIKQQAAIVPPAPPVLVLLQATYSFSSGSVQLAFDRAIDASGLVSSAFTVSDGDYHYLMGGDGPAEMVDDSTMLLYLEPIGSVSDPGIFLNVAEGNGIVAAGDGGVWPGVSGVVLPFG